MVCATEFGRTPTVEYPADGVIVPEKVGRDHDPYGFTSWVAGGGVRGGMSYGATDEFGFVAVENPVHVHDLHATILHLLGLDHKRLTYRYAGRDFRLTDVHGNVRTRHPRLTAKQNLYRCCSGERLRRYECEFRTNRVSDEASLFIG